jgi:sugar lactone lactonase YvrE
MKKTSTQIKVLLVLLITTGLSACMKSNNLVATLPAMITYDVVIDPTSTSAWSGAFLTSGTSSFTAYGVCWSTTNKEPTIADSKTSEPLVLLSCTSNLTGLSPNTTYYARAYATNSAGTGYGNVIKFTTGSNQSNAYKAVSTLAGNLTPGFVNGTSTAAMFNSPMGMATDAAGNVYVSDSYNSAIRKITPAGVVTTIAGIGQLGYLDGPAATAKFYSPSGLAIDANGNIFVADRGNNMIRKITPAGVVSTFAGSGNAGYTDGTGTAATFNTPSGVAVDASGNLYVADYGNNLIRKITSAGVVTTVAGNRVVGYANGQGIAAIFNKPTSIAIDAAGNIYVTEPYNNAIRKISADYMVTTLAGGPSATTLVGSPIAINIDATGNMFIADFNGRILKISAGKILTVLAGKSGTTGSTDGDGNNALFNKPQGITSGASGNIYIADFGNNLIRKVNSN